jgi:protoheme IX farnesyltransferase
MIQSSVLNSGSGVLAKVRDYLQLVKLSLTIMVVFSSVMAFVLTPSFGYYEDPWKWVFLLFAGGMLVTGSANAINQVVEKDTDAMMKRTARRPVAAGRMSVQEAWAFAIIAGAAGILILVNFFNWMAAGLALLSLFLYAFIYTPLKKINSIAVLVGAIPGALPCLIGWAAGDDRLTIGGWILFGIQFLWQFPHFWAIAWIAHTDYSRVGFKLLPTDKGPTKFTALQTVIYSLLLLPVTLVPYYTGMCEYGSAVGKTGLILIVAANIFMILRGVKLYRTMEVTAARKVMFGSYLYLPAVLLALLLSKV